MPVTLKIPLRVNASRIRYPATRFSAPFAAGRYSFNQAANTVDLMKLESNSLYLIAAFSFFANVADSDWLESMDTKKNFPSYQLKYKNSSTPSIYPDPIQCVNYVDNADQLVFFESGRRGNLLQIVFGGIVNQVAGMVGKVELLAEVNLTMYQITDQEFVKNYHNPEFRSKYGLL